MKNKYKEYEKFVEVSFELPNIEDMDAFVEHLLVHCPEAVNISMIPCEIRYDPSRLRVVKDDNCVTVYNTKQKSQIIDNRYILDDEEV